MREYYGINKPLKERYVIRLQRGEQLLNQIKGYKLGKLISQLAEIQNPGKNNQREDMLLCL